MEPLASPSPGYMLQRHLEAQSTALQQRLATGGTHAAGQGEQLDEEVTELASLFIFQMLQAMRRTVPKSELLNQGFAHDLYHSLFDQEVASHIASREDLGLTSLLRQQFSGHDSGIRHTEPWRGALEAYRQQQPHDPDAFALPVQGHLASPYGWRQDPLGQGERFHHGIDIAAPAGSPVRAAAPGEVIFSGEEHGYGNLVILAHHDGYETYYAHNAKNLVTVGDRVTREQSIAQVGESGRATGPHLHFELRKDGQALDPAAWIHGASRLATNR